MPSIRLDEGLSLHCAVDDYLWPWEAPTPVLMMHGFARNAAFWNRWVPAIAESRRIKCLVFLKGKLVILIGFNRLDQAAVNTAYQIRLPLGPPGAGQPRF
jgi:hypothetical protein